MTRTQKKLNEAKFFLNELIKSKKNTDKFDYLLSAFLGSARSVTWTMCSEFSKNVSWEKWWESKKPSDKEKKVLSLFTKLRNKSQKTNSIEMGLQFEINIKIRNDEEQKLLGDFLKVPGKYLITLTENVNDDGRVLDSSVALNVDGKSNKLEFSQARILNLDKIFLGSTYNMPNSIKVVEACECYYNLLEDLVEECLVIISP